MRNLILCTSLSLALPALATAQDGDATQGRLLAEEHCARCHAIEDGGEMKMHPPSFDAIAQFRPADQIAGRIWFPATHASMPPMTSLFDAQQVADLTAYIVSLDAE